MFILLSYNSQITVLTEYVVHHILLFLSCAFSFCIHSISLIISSFSLLLVILSLPSILILSHSPSFSHSQYPCEQSIINYRFLSHSSETILEALNQPKRFFPCSIHPHNLESCQQHYLLVWNSRKRFFDYQKPLVPSNPYY